MLALGVSFRFGVGKCLDSDQRTFGLVNPCTKEPSERRTFGTMNLGSNKSSEQRHGSGFCDNVYDSFNFNADLHTVECCSCADTSSNGICVSTFIFGCLPVCGTGKHPNINVETQIPLELCGYIAVRTGGGGGGAAPPPIFCQPKRIEFKNNNI